MGNLSRGQAAGSGCLPARPGSADIEKGCQLHPWYLQQQRKGMRDQNVHKFSVSKVLVGMG